MSNKIPSGERNSKYFICYLFDDYKIKLLHIMLPKTRVYVKSYDGQTKWIYFLLKITYLKNLILFGIKSALILKMNLKVNV